LCGPRIAAGASVPIDVSDCSWVSNLFALGETVVGQSVGVVIDPSQLFVGAKVDSVDWSGISELDRVQSLQIQKIADQHCSLSSANGQFAAAGIELDVIDVSLGLPLFSDDLKRLRI
jgi:hypothetical protein